MLLLSEAELHLENTFLNGQCFNWWKSPTNSNVFFGVYRAHFVTVERTAPESVTITAEPRPSDTSQFESEFKQYINFDAKVPELYKDWSVKDPNLFGSIATQMVGIRCLRQDPFECTMSFICSQNNNIKRIF